MLTACDTFVLCKCGETKILIINYIRANFKFAPVSFFFKKGMYCFDLNQHAQLCWFVLTLIIGNNLGSG